MSSQSVLSILALTLCFAQGPAWARAPALTCAHVLAHGQAPVLSVKTQSRMLCYRAYAVLHSGQTRTPVWAAEHLTRTAVEAARKLPRDSDFFEESRLPAAERASLADYAGSGLDRGHLAPSGDFADKTSQAESFSLANVIPQHPHSNRRVWSHIETATRRLVRKTESAYVVTGPAFVRNAGTLRGRVRIPDFVWKAIYIPGAGAAAYVVRNDATAAYSTASIEELQHFTGVDPFPGLPKAQRAIALELPPPAPHPGEKPARRVAFAWLVAEGFEVNDLGHPTPLAGALRQAWTTLSLAAALPW